MLRVFTLLMLLSLVHRIYSGATCPSGSFEKCSDKNGKIQRQKDKSFTCSLGIQNCCTTVVTPQRGTTTCVKAINGAR
ncbi:hypothetical protein PGT21_026811 [Puccinia graminis f. sp. tritici]|uniref:Secreted protein n=1 Tax=Puccinia graminis f. sp. tritici TaxID=56615 RepID=A0A5B0RB99_PUCGR|nr:hypothetical protein PGT21_025606 [Puccinia graminis f. sp. tritici]KAA1108831.1 hypothetical protein PGT21_026811 [Puccinia graminis f. sp. tritici]KAA1122345.1 hypothetical protein PGTUg99_036893 [Puccinia graminis f. sp. tritici]KAA1129006.1 hypothetical protein PGTUg99_022027 [Puccinia graminis f. sp. tritici]